MKNRGIEEHVSYCSVAVKRHHQQHNFCKKTSAGLLKISEVLFKIIVVGSLASGRTAGRHGILLEQ